MIYLDFMFQYLISLDLFRIPLQICMYKLINPKLTWQHNILKRVNNDTIKTMNPLRRYWMSRSNRATSNGEEVLMLCPKKTSSQVFTMANRA